MNAIFDFILDSKNVQIIFDTIRALIVAFSPATLGFAFQKPITGVAAWVMVVTKRPFEIGDRVIIGNVKGDVADITLTHIHINEIGGTVQAEGNSVRPT